MNVRDIKGIGEKTEKLFNKLSIYTDRDLIEYYPRNYDWFTPPVTLNMIDSTNGIPAVEGVIVSNPVNLKIRNLNILSVNIKDNNGEILKLTWFNMPYLKNSLKIGYKYIFRGQIKRDK